MYDIYRDIGNAWTKYVVPAKGNAVEHKAFRTELAELSEHDWQRVTDFGKELPNNGYYMVNGVPYAVGDLALRSRKVELPKGSQRYSQSFYGVLSAVVTYENLMRRKSVRNSPDIPVVRAWAMYPPIDHQYKEKLIDSISGRFSVLGSKGELIFDVEQVFAYDEPLGGLSHFVLDEMGRTNNKNRRMKEDSTLVVDKGGLTEDYAVVEPDEDGQLRVDMTALNSFSTGINYIYDKFDKALRDEFLDEFAGVLNIDSKRLEYALINGVYKYGKVELDCSHIADQFLTQATNDTMAVIRSAGGIQNYGSILFTGGAGAVVAPEVEKRIGHKINIYLADKDSRMMIYSNLKGLIKTSVGIKRLLAKQGV